jgi:membrane-bound lytic murein transglycosylase F
MAADRLFAIGDDSSSFFPRRQRRREPLRVACGGAVRLQTLDEGEPLESVLDQVALGGYPAAVVDSALYDWLPPDERRRVIGVLADRRPLVWAVRSGSPRLRALVDSFLLAEQALLHTSQMASCRDLPEIRRAGQLRVVSRSSPTTCYSEEGGRHGFEYELARAFARRLGVRLELTFPPPAVDPLDWLAAGFGDLAAVHDQWTRCSKAACG